MEHDVIVGRRCASLVMERSRSAGPPRHVDAKRPGHAEMHQECLAGGEIGDQVLPSAAKPHDRLTAKARRKPWRQGRAQVGPARNDFLEARSLHYWAQRTTDCFDFRQLGHSAYVTIHGQRER
jgi:hypothetical protein